MAESSKKTKGKQKIEIKRIEDDNDRLVTFSKRRSGIFKKASEIVTLTGAEIGVIVFSPSGKPYSFGHPSIEAISNRFLGVNLEPNKNANPFFEARRQARINELIEGHKNLLGQLDNLKERGKMFKKMTKEKNTQDWWEAPIDEMNLKEALEMGAKFEELSKILLDKLNEKSLGGLGASSSSFPPINPSQPRSYFPANGDKSNP
ncbi:hypothetical protein Ddye_024419 [Dipteronia dyeriana]|uniref:MADS-box domain-containing protein n=1 Tax=Dipteronia dyeriana TaxID=168575 RepID=A0AAD9TUY8_9ROSI|nr:hypothetical protein Ddye_024419 [Dipteronia dyeriana]